MNLTKKFSSFSSPKGNIGKALLVLMNVTHTPASLWSLSHLDIKEDAEILDIGCGGGSNLARLLKRAPSGRVSGIDPSPDAVDVSFRYNRKAVEEGRFFVYEGTADLLPFESSRFDIVTAFETIYFWKDLQKCLKEVRRGMKPGATLLISNEADGEGFLDEFYPKLIPGMTVYTVGELVSELTRAGFVRIETDTKLGCITIAARKPESALTQIKEAARFDRVRKWGSIALISAAVLAAGLILYKNNKNK